MDPAGPRDSANFRNGPFAGAIHGFERSPSFAVKPIHLPVDDGAVGTGALCRIGDRQTLFNVRDDLAATLRWGVCCTFR